MFERHFSRRAAVGLGVTETARAAKAAGAGVTEVAFRFFLWALCVALRAIDEKLSFELDAVEMLWLSAWRMAPLALQMVHSLHLQ